MTKQTLYNKVRSKAQLCFLLFMGGALLVGCKEKKEQPDEIAVDKGVDKPHTEIQRMNDETIDGTVTWIGGGNYSFSTVRTADESLAKVKNHDFEYYDNAIHLTVKRSDGSTFFDKRFTKQSFSSILPAQFKESGVLLGMNFEEVSGNLLKFVVSVGSPDDSYDEYFHILLTVNNYGATSTSVHKPKR